MTVFGILLPVTAYEKIFDAVVDSYGIITTAQAKELGITKETLSKLAHRGRLDRIGYGLYRLACPMPYSSDYAPYAQSVALVGPEAYLYGESVIAMLRLAPTNPAVMFVATPARVRKRLERGFKVIKTPPCEHLEYYEGVASQPVAEAIRSCLGTMMPDRLEAAVVNSVRKGYVGHGESRKLLKEIRNHGKASEQ